MTEPVSKWGGPTRAQAVCTGCAWTHSTTDDEEAHRWGDMHADATGHRVTFDYMGDRR